MGFTPQALVSGNFFLPRYYIYYLGKKKLPETSACASHSYRGTDSIVKYLFHFF